MSASYDPTLPTDRDYVRFLIGDTNVSSSSLISDEEIDAVLTEESATVGGRALKYFAAAACLLAIQTRWLGEGKGVFEQQISKLRIRRGIDQTIRSALEARAKELRSLGAYHQDEGGNFQLKAL